MEWGGIDVSGRRVSRFGSRRGPRPGSGRGSNYNQEKSYPPPQVTGPAVHAGFNEYFVPAAGIAREVIQHRIGLYLGPEAIWRPSRGRDGQAGYVVRSYRPLTTPIVESLKNDTVAHQAVQVSRFGHPGVPYLPRNEAASPGTSLTQGSISNGRIPNPRHTEDDFAGSSKSEQLVLVRRRNVTTNVPSGAQGEQEDIRNEYEREVMSTSSLDTPGTNVKRRKLEHAFRQSDFKLGGTKHDTWSDAKNDANLDSDSASPDLRESRPDDAFAAPPTPRIIQPQNYPTKSRFGAFRRDLRESAEFQQISPSDLFQESILDPVLPRELFMHRSPNPDLGTELKWEDHARAGRKYIADQLHDKSSRNMLKRDGPSDLAPADAPKIPLDRSSDFFTSDGEDEGDYGTAVSNLVGSYLRRRKGPFRTSQKRRRSTGIDVKSTGTSKTNESAPKIAVNVLQAEFGACISYTISEDRTGSQAEERIRKLAVLAKRGNCLRLHVDEEQVGPRGDREARMTAAKEHLQRVRAELPNYFHEDATYRDWLKHPEYETLGWTKQDA